MHLHPKLSVIYSCSLFRFLRRFSFLLPCSFLFTCRENSNDSNRRSNERQTNSFWGIKRPRVHLILILFQLFLMFLLNLYFMKITSFKIRPLFIEAIPYDTKPLNYLQNAFGAYSTLRVALRSSRYVSFTKVMNSNTVHVFTENMSDYDQLSKFFFDDYMKFHERQQSNKSARVLIFRPHHTGIGDRFRPFAFAYWAAVISQRVFLVDWNSPFPLNTFLENNRQFHRSNLFLSKTSSKMMMINNNEKIKVISTKIDRNNFTFIAESTHDDDQIVVFNLHTPPIDVKLINFAEKYVPLRVRDRNKLPAMYRTPHFQRRLYHDVFCLSESIREDYHRISEKLNLRFPQNETSLPQSPSPSSTSLSSTSSSFTSFRHSIDTAVEKNVSREAQKILETNLDESKSETNSKSVTLQNSSIDILSSMQNYASDLHSILSGLSLSTISSLLLKGGLTNEFNSKRPYVGVHARLGLGLGEGGTQRFKAIAENLLVPARCLASRAIQISFLIGRSIPLPIFLATDTPNFRFIFREIVDEMSDGRVRVLFGDWDVTHTDHMHGQRHKSQQFVFNSEQYPEEWHIVRGTYLDLILLGHAEHIVSIFSNFPVFAHSIGDAVSLAQLKPEICLKEHWD